MMPKYISSKYIVALVVVLAITGVSYAGWRVLNNRQGMIGLNEKIDDEQKSKQVPSQPSTSGTSDWKTFRHDDYRLEIQYPPYYYAVLSTGESLLSSGRGTPSFALRLSEVPPGISVKDTAQPDISIEVYKQLTTTDVVTLLRTKYGDVTQKKVTIGGHDGVVLEWTQQAGITPERMVIESPEFLYIIYTDFNSPLTQEILLHLKLL